MRRISSVRMGAAMTIALIMTCAAVAFEVKPQIIFDSDAEPGFVSSVNCAKCHIDIFGYWKDSMHAHALDDPIFQVAYMQALSKEGDGIREVCLRCHAPTVALTGDVMLELPITNEAITCDFCHRISQIDAKGDFAKVTVTAGDAKYGPLKSKNVENSHPSVQSALFVDSAFCATCHQWSNAQGISIFDTYREWQNGPYPAKGIHCQNCHMPLVQGAVVTNGSQQSTGKINSHNLSGGHSIVQVSSAAAVSIASLKRVAGGLEAMVEVTNVGSGHMLPTGIPSRQLILEVQLLDSNGTIVETEKHIFSRTILDEEHNPLGQDADMILKGAIISKDNRIPPGETVSIPFSFAAAPQKKYRVKAKLSYSYRPLVLKEEEIIIEMGSDIEGS